MGFILRPPPFRKALHNEKAPGKAAAKKREKRLFLSQPMKVVVGERKNKRKGKNKVVEYNLALSCWYRYRFTPETQQMRLPVLLQLSNATIFPQTAEKENTERDFVGNYAALQKRLVSSLFTFGNSIDLRYRHQRLGMQITPPRKNKSEIKTQRGNSPAKKKIVGKAQKTGT